MEAVVRATAENGGKFVLAGGLTLASPQKEWYYKVLGKRFPELILKYENLYAGNYGPPANTLERWERRWPTSVRSMESRIACPDTLAREDWPSTGG